MPQVQSERNVICFNYFREGQLINVKYRDGEKNFKLVKDAEKIFYNLDGIKGQKEIYIVEGRDRLLDHGASWIHQHRKRSKRCHERQEQFGLHG
jgi:hypothetical protein